MSYQHACCSGERTQVIARVSAFYRAKGIIGRISASFDIDVSFDRISSEIFSFVKRQRFKWGYGSTSNHP